MKRNYFGTDGVRGRVGEPPITPEMVLRLGHAAGRVFAAESAGRPGVSPAVLIGKDTRISGYMLEAALGSSGLHETLGSALQKASPLKASSCDQKFCLFGACVCLLSSEVDYLDTDGSHIWCYLSEHGHLRGEAIDQRGAALEIAVREPIDGWRVVHLPHDFIVEGTFAPTSDASHGSLPTTTGCRSCATPAGNCRCRTSTSATPIRNSWSRPCGVG